MAKKTAKAKKTKQPKKGAKVTSASKGALTMIGVSDFTNLVRRCKALKSEAQVASGSAGEMIKNAVENKNLDRIAFGIFRKLESMPAQKLATTLACLDYYIDIGKLEDRIDAEPALPIKRQEAGEQEAEQPKADNVTPLRAAE